MLVTILTKTGGPLGPIAGLLGLIMNGIYEFFHLFGIQNIALSIFVFTFIARALMLPITIKQQKFTKLSSRMNPELQKIQAKYKGKKDEASLRKQQAETQAVYQKYGASPTAGCLPMLISLPIMFALYYVIQNIPAYVPKIKEIYQPVADSIYNTQNYSDIMTTLAKGLRYRVTDFSSTDKIINALAQFGTTKWNELSASFPQFKDVISTASAQVKNVNSFFGLNIANAPKFAFPAILIPIFAAALSYVQGKQLQVKNKDTNKDNPAASAMNSMNIVMPVMQFFFCITFPIGIGLYWIATSLFTIIQQYFVNKYLDKIDVDELIEKSVAKASKRKSYMQSNGLSLSELAKTQTKSIENANEKAVNINDKQQESEESPAVNETSTGPKSITEIANLLKSRNEKGDK